MTVSFCGHETLLFPSCGLVDWPVSLGNMRELRICRFCNDGCGLIESLVAPTHFVKHTENRHARVKSQRTEEDTRSTLGIISKEIPCLVLISLPRVWSVSYIVIFCRRRLLNVAELWMDNAMAKHNIRPHRKFNWTHAAPSDEENCLTVSALIFLPLKFIDEIWTNREIDIWYSWEMWWWFIV